MDQNLRDALDQYAQFGVRAVFLTAPDACETCQAQSEKAYEPADAPPIPVPGCTNDVCRCDYTPEI